MKFINDPSEEIRAVRKALGWSRADLGSRIGVSEKGISAWELGTKVPKIQNFKKLANVLGLDVDAWKPVIEDYHKQKRSTLENCQKSKKKHQPKESIADICKEAAKLGMTYGQYVLWRAAM